MPRATGRRGILLLGPDRFEFRSNDSCRTSGKGAWRGCPARHDVWDAPGLLSASGLRRAEKGDGRGRNRPACRRFEEAGIRPIRPIRATGDSMKAYCIQHDIVWEDKPATHARVRELLKG